MEMGIQTKLTPIQTVMVGMMTTKKTVEPM